MNSIAGVAPKKTARCRFYLLAGLSLLLVLLFAADGVRKGVDTVVPNYYRHTASLAIAISFLLMTKVASDESGNLSVITGYRIGYWLWLASTGVAVASALPLSKRAKGGDDRERPTRALS